MMLKKNEHIMYYKSKQVQGQEVDGPQLLMYTNTAPFHDNSFVKIQL